ncbi:MAG: hypothetical protein Q8R48_05585 [Candidatus Omnitrophota bacterium]|nr:hypothetical protein [Candidatus Omnitrophota bacterium]
MKTLVFLSILMISLLAYGEGLPEKCPEPEAFFVEMIIRINPDVIIMPEGTYKAPLGEIEIKSSEIKDLNRKYNLISIERMYAKKKSAEEVAKEFPEREARAPEGAEAPDLENTFLLKFPEHTDIRELINEYKATEGVIYIEENRTVSIF